MLRKSGHGSEVMGRTPSATPYSDMVNGATSMTGLDSFYQNEVLSPAQEVQQGIVERTLYLLSNPSITTRCIELTKLLGTTHTLELREVYPFILHHAFGWESTPGWRLRSLKRDFSVLESEEIMKFLRPDGPLLELAYRLMADPNLHYDFPVHAMPVGLQHKLGTSDVSNYISSKLQDRSYGDLSSSYNLVLSPFELFFFHYAYSETRQSLESIPSTVSVSLSSNITDSIYSDLLEEYLIHFVPISDNYRKVGNLVPNASYAAFQKPKYVIVPPSKQNNNFLMDDCNSDPPTMFKASVFQAETTYHDQPHFNTHKNPTMESEFWRTEAFLNILISMWLSVDEDDIGYKFKAFDKQGTILPTVELVKSTRIIIRHWHLFSNVIKRTVSHPMEELRRKIFPLLQKRLYHFLRHIFPRWPLDPSFRIVYETWLSYIQPWRYTQSGTQRGVDPVGMDASAQPWNLDITQCNFVLENISFYTTLFQLMLIRLSRADFSALRNAHMLFRITKIYCAIENLRPVLYEMEKRILTESGDGPSFHWQFGEEQSSSPLLDVSTFFSANSFNDSFVDGFPSTNSFSPLPFVPSSIKVATVKQMISDLEGKEVLYVPLFSKVNRDKVVELVANISHIIKLCEIPPPKPQIETVRTDWWGRFIGLFSSSNSTPTQSPKEYHNQLEMGKRAQYLSMSRTNLIKLFNLSTQRAENILRDEPEITLGRVLSDSLDSSVNSHPSFSFNESDTYVGPGVLCVPRGYIPGGYLELRNGNPDKAEPMSYEIKTLVGISRIISNYFNHWITPWGERLYFGDSWKSRLCRATLARPEHYYELKKTGPGKSVREKKYLPPRLNFRILASTNMPYFVIAYALLSWFFGISGLNLVLLPIFIVIIYLIMRALFEPKHFLAKVRYEFTQHISARANEIRVQGKPITQTQDLHND